MNLRIEWPRPVNGDTQAAMVIRNEGQGRLRITVADNLTPGGAVQQMSEIVLARQWWGSLSGFVERLAHGSQRQSEVLRHLSGSHASQKSSPNRFALSLL